jgi:hypothetical protein
MSRALALQVVLALAGLGLGVAGLGMPSATRLPVEVLACLIVPWALYFRSFARVIELPIRVGASLIAVIGSWVAVSTAIFATRVGVSDASVAAILAVIYLLGTGAFVALGRGQRGSVGARQEP